jgi:hypothetical protein
VKTWGRYFLMIASYGLVTGTTYWFLTHEWAGSVLLWSLAAMPLVVWLYAYRHGSFRHLQPEDDPDTEPEARAGEEVGEFPGQTAWPIFLVLGVIVTGAALVYGLILLPIGVALITWAVLGLMRESRG